MNSVSSRAVGQFPLSIATSLALEGAIGIHPDHSVKKNHLIKYNELWINVRTLYRNLMGSLDKDVAGSIHPSELAETIITEMDTIESVVREYSQGTKVVYYISNYRGIETKYKHAVPRLDNTEGQKLYTAMSTKTIGLLLKSNNGQSGILVFDLKLKPSNVPTTLILTNYAFDLVSSKNFTKLSLLESHTGIIKDRDKWHTKYHGGKDLPMIPFREDLLTIFGDSSHFRPMSIKLRNEIIEVATKYHWSAITTKEKIIFSINTITNPWAKDLIRDILI